VQVGLAVVSAAIIPPPDQEAAVEDVGDIEVFVHLPGALSTALWRRAKLEGRTMAAVMRAALCLYLDQANGHADAAGLEP
jgi:hypothetical protein